MGAADTVSVVIRQSLVQILTPDEMRGRVIAVSSLFISASNHLGDFRAGLVASLIGVVPAVEDLDLTGLDVSAEAVTAALLVDPEQWTQECASTRGHFESFGTHLPSALLDELTALESRLG